MRASVAIVGIICLVAVLGGHFLAEPVAASPDGVETDVENASQTIEIHLEEDGDANVSVYKQFSLETEEDREAFEQLAEDFESGNTDDELSATVFERLAEQASNETDREMAVENVTRETDATASTGTLELHVQWTNFANATDDRIEIGDTFVIDGELWLSSLSSDQRLIIHAPDGYAVENASTSVNDGVLVWEGPQDFESGDLDATLVASNGINEGVSLLTVGLGLGLVAAIILLIYLISQRHGPATGPGRETSDGGWTTLIAPAGEERNGNSVSPEPEPAPDREPESDDPFTRADEELLSDEERVIRLLEANDGRMKQATIVTETGWSNAKVSQLLSSMADDGRIEKLRIGRENLISLADEE